MSGNTLQLLQLQWEAKIWKLTAFLLPIGIVCMLVGGIMAHDLIEVFGYPLFPGPFLSIFSLVLFNVARTYQHNIRVLIAFIALAVFCSLLFHGFANLVVALRHPSFDTLATDYHALIPALWHIYATKLLLTFFIVLIEMYLFAYLFFKRKWWFISASFTASVVLMVIGSVLIGFFAFRDHYAAHIQALVWANLVRNIIVLFIYSLVAQPFVYWIHQRYLA